MLPQSTYRTKKSNCIWIMKIPRSRYAKPRLSISHRYWLLLLLSHNFRQDRWVNAAHMGFSFSRLQIYPTHRAFVNSGRYTPFLAQGITHHPFWRECVGLSISWTVSAESEFPKALVI